MMETFQIELGGKVFHVPFREEPDTSILSQPVNGPEHNCKVAQLLRLLKSKRPEMMELNDDEGMVSYDSREILRVWLEELHRLETGLAEELRIQLEADAGEYL